MTPGPDTALKVLPHPRNFFNLFFRGIRPQSATARFGFASLRMAPIKRKGNAPEENTSRQPQKRAKVGAEEAKKDHKKPTDATTSTAGKASELSVLRDDEPSFPRGGASVLTPLERKQIQIQANRDVLFEQKSSQKPSQKKPSNEFDEESDDDVEMEDEQQNAAPNKKSRKKKSKGKKSADKESADKQDVRIEGLSFKACTPKSYYPYFF